MKNWPGAQKTFCWFLWTMVVFDLRFLADWVRIFSLKDETVNFLLGKTQVDYFLSQRSLLLVKLKTWRMVSSVNFLCRHLPQKTTIQRRDQKRWFSRVVQDKNAEAGCQDTNLNRATCWWYSFGNPLTLSVPLCPHWYGGTNTDKAPCLTAWSWHGNEVCQVTGHQKCTTNVHY